MNKIDFKKGRYIIPLIVLPFLFIFNYLYLDTFPAAGETASEPGTALMVETTSLNTDLPDANLKKREVKDKFAASREEHKYRTDYSAIRELGEGGTREQQYGSVYSAEEQAILDSLNNQILANQQQAPFMERVNQRQDRTRYASASVPARRAPRKTESEYEKEMRMFREQMAYVDSLSKAGNEPVSKPAHVQNATLPTEPAPEALAVSKTANPNSAYFNTVSGAPAEQFIKAILDEGLKVREGGRIRVRLLDDIYVADMEIEKGSYLYGLVSGFSAQRVEITITSILNGDEVLPVSLSVYDNDGLKGLYVPDSQFREFTKELASRATQGQSVNFGSDASNSAEMLYSMADRMAQTATRAAGNAIKKNKAKLKYNTIVYLIDNKAKKR
ncbi:conjugative transposon TraM protein [Pontibacter ummariensis]|uniref:Bacteroides conjugative transposon TraM protein n=1 Tax=Pontibacter ummariensis TaxID=1610492 RepID=A0A239DTK6_9BACT|nr:conjugative transposon protein TraM [Pontibacter ummariensis]PRY13759.1 conjugative transposon TraM protein [Pontibacter ummariensis]SNS35840.1 Bacteroides conjugative transposon TraM protein [Pontibacter ummariensis]